MKLSANIRELRRQRGMTQEKFAEVFGVTTGAVYKWESGLSVPDLTLILEMADFFGVSTDMLLGYQMKNNRLESALEELDSFIRDINPENLAAADKILKKYPNNLKIAMKCAGLYYLSGLETRNREMFEHAVSLLEKASQMVGQSTDPEISEYTISAEIGAIYMAMGEHEKGLELMKKNNIGGIYNDSIGISLAAFMHRPEEAEPYLLKGLLQSFGTFSNSTLGYVLLFCERGDYPAARDSISWLQEILEGMLQEKDESGFQAKTKALISVIPAYVEIKSGNTEKAHETLIKAAEYARLFDKDPDYSFSRIRSISISIPDGFNMHDSLGVTAAESIKTLIQILKSSELETMWQGVTAHE